MPSRTFTRILLADLFMFALLYGSLYYAYYFAIGGVRPFLTAMVLLAPFFAMTATRKVVTSLPVFLGVHVLLCVFPIWLNLDPALGGFMLLFLLISALYSLIFRLRGAWWPDKGLVLFCVGLAAIMALIGEYLAVPGPSGVLALCSFVLIVCHLVCSQTAHVDSALELLSPTARQPVSVTEHFNNFILGAFLLLVSVAGVIAVLLPLDKLGRLLVDFFLSLYRRINDLLLRLLAWLGGPPPVESGDVAPPDLSALVPPPRQSPAWAQMLERIFTTLVFAAFFAGLIYLAARGLYGLYKHFYAPLPPEGERREYIGPRLEPKNLRRLLRRKRRYPLFGGDEEDQVRRAYFRKVRRYIRHGVKVHPADTTGEIEQRLKERENLADLTKKYNRARYNSKRK